MLHESVPHLLTHVDLFHSLSPDIIDEIAQQGTSFQLPPGRVVAQQGSEGAGLHVVVEGSAEVSVDGVPRATLTAGDFFGEVSLIDGKPRSATVTAGPDGLHTFALSPLAFSPLIDKYPDLARTLLKALCARLRAVESRH